VGLGSRGYKVLSSELISLLKPTVMSRSAARHVLAIEGDSAPAAVLVILHYHAAAVTTPRLILTKRSANLRTHKSEISFPGGRHSPGEDRGNLLHTALRETREEIGLEFAENEVLGSLKPVNTMTSNHHIVPFVTVQDRLAEQKMAPEEVEKIIDAPLIETLQTMSPDMSHRVLAKDACQFNYGEDIIWGATARILKQLHDVLIRPS
jgi:8-oxo-dGTP pyrophosphatase MutT (NUDIX family)